MKNHLLLLLAILSWQAANAKLDIVGTYSGGKGNNNGGIPHYVIADNGNTFSFSRDKNSIEMTVYNNSQKKTMTSAVNISSIKKYSWFSSITAISVKENIVLFAVGVGKDDPVLARVIIEANTGKVKEEKVVGTLPYVNTTHKYLLPHSELNAVNKFLIRKDDRSDCYAIATVNGDADNENERVEIAHFNSNNEEINRSYFDISKEDSRFLAYLDMEVSDSTEVNFLICGIKRSRLSNPSFERNDLLLLHLGQGKKGEVFKIAVPRERELYAGLIRKNKKLNSYVVASADYLFRPETRIASIGTFKLDATGISDFKWEDVSTDNNIVNGYSTIAIPQEVTFNQDGSFQVYSEYIGDKQRSYQKMVGGGVSNVYIKTVIGDITIQHFGSDGLKQEAATISKNYLYPSKVVPVHLMANHSNTNTLVNPEQGVLSFFLLNSEGKNYVFFNQSSETGEKLKDIETAGTFVLTVDGNLPAGNNKGQSLGDKKMVTYLSLADYNGKCNLLVFPQYDPVTKENSLTWIRPGE